MATKNSSGNNSSSNNSGGNSSGGISDDMRKLLAHQLEIKSWLLEVLILVSLFICIITITTI